MNTGTSGNACTIRSLEISEGDEATGSTVAVTLQPLQEVVGDADRRWSEDDDED